MFPIEYSDEKVPCQNSKRGEVIEDPRQGRLSPQNDMMNCVPIPRDWKDSDAMVPSSRSIDTGSRQGRLKFDSSQSRTRAERGLD